MTLHLQQKPSLPHKLQATSLSVMIKRHIKEKQKVPSKKMFILIMNLIELSLNEVISKVN
jgi:hypothetical protein